MYNIISCKKFLIYYLYTKQVLHIKSIESTEYNPEPRSRDTLDKTSFQCIELLIITRDERRKRLNTEKYQIILTKSKSNLYTNEKFYKGGYF